MSRSTRILFTALLAASLVFSASLVDSLKSGKANLQSAGPLAFGPEGILFIGDSKAAAIFAIDTGDRKSNPSPTAVEMEGINAKIAALLGSTPDQVRINDLAVNPISKQAYFSVSRGAEATPVIVRLDASGKLAELRLDNVKFSTVALPNAPESAANSRGQNPRMEAITDLGWVDGRVLVAGLSNEEFSSNLRSIPFPFQTADRGALVQMYHGAHGRFETNSPVRTFVPYKIDGQQHILAAYTCTPLVKFPLDALKPGQKIMGTTIAELGNRNRPLDMVVYNKAGKEFILMNNSSRGVMKLPTEKIGTYSGITDRISDKAGVPYETIAEWKGVQQLDLLDGARAMMLVEGDAGSLNLKTVALP